MGILQRMMTKDAFQEMLTQVTSRISSRALDQNLGRELNQPFPPKGEFYDAILGACKEGAAEGWICVREADGMPCGPVVKPSPTTHSFSGNVVEQKDVVRHH